MGFVMTVAQAITEYNSVLLTLRARYQKTDDALEGSEFLKVQIKAMAENVVAGGKPSGNPMEKWERTPVMDEAYTFIEESYPTFQALRRTVEIPETPGPDQIVGW